MEQVGLRLTGDTSNLQQALQRGGRDLQDFATRARRDLAGVGDAAESAGSKALSLNQVLGLFTTREIARFGWRIVTGELSQFEQAMVSAETQAQKLGNTLKFAVGRDVAAQDMAFLRETSHALGLEFVSTAQQYARLAASARGTNMEGQQTRELFVAIAEASAVMGLSVEETEGSFRAVQQMLSKGKVQAEELRGQLGERLPGAFQIAARAMGVTTAQLDKMLETGQVYADDFLPKFAAQLRKELGGSVSEAANSAQAATNRYTNAVTELKQALADSGIYETTAQRQAKVAATYSEMAQRLREAKVAHEGMVSSVLSGMSVWIQRSGTDIGRFVTLTDQATKSTLGFFGLATGSSKEMQADLVKAKARLAELQAQSEVMGNNIYWKDQMVRAQAYVASLEHALQLQGKLANDDARILTPDQAAQRYYQANPRNRGYEQEERRQIAGRTAVANLRNKSMGIEDSWVNQLTELKRLEDQGFLSFEDRQQIAQRLTAQQFKKPADKTNPNDAVFRSISERTSELRQQQQAEEDLTSAQKLAAKVLDDLRTGTVKLSDAEKVRMGAALQSLLTEDKANTEREKAKKLREEEAKIIQKNEEAASKAAEAASRRVDQEVQANEQMRQEIAMLGMDEEQRAKYLQVLEAEKIARLEIDLVQAKNIEGNEAEVASLEREISVRKQRAELLGAKAVAEGAKKAREEWDKTVDEISQSLSDALMRGFEDGKSFAQNFRDTLVNMFKTMVLQPTIKAIVVGAMGGGNGQGGAGGGGMGGLSNNYGLISAGYQFLTGSSAGASAASLGYANAVGAFGGDSIGALAAANGGWAGVAAGGGASALGAGATTFGVVDTAAAGASLAGGAGVAGGVGGAAGAGVLAAIPVAGWVALGAMALYSMFGNKGGGPKSNAFYNPFNSDVWYGKASDGNNPQARAASKQLEDQYNAIAKIYGAASGVKFGVGFSSDPKGTAPTMVHVGAGINGESVSLTNSNVGRSDEDLQAAIAQMGAQAVLKALQDANIGGEMGAYLRSLGDAATLSADQVTEAINRVQKAGSERATLEEKLFALTHTQLEQVARAREQELAALDETNHALAKQVYALEDLRAGVDSASGALQAAVAREQQALQQKLQEVSQVVSMLDGALASYRTDEQTGLQRQEAIAQIQAMVAIAKASGVMPDQEQLRQALEVVTRPSEDLYSTFVDYVTARDREAATISELSGLAQGQQSVDEQQLQQLQDILAQAQAQLDAINGTTTAVLSVQEALAGLNAAFAAYAAGKTDAAAAIASEAAAAPAPAPAPASAPAQQELWTYGSYFDYLKRTGQVPAGSTWDDLNNTFNAGGGSYATGGAFTNGIVSRPTMFNVGQMGEGDTPEAIMPLVNVGGHLGVRALGQSNEGVISAIERMQAQLDGHQEVLRAIAGFMARSTRAVEEVRDRGVTVNTDADSPLQVQTV